MKEEEKEGGLRKNAPGYCATLRKSQLVHWTALLQKLLEEESCVEQN